MGGWGSLFTMMLVYSASQVERGFMGEKEARDEELSGWRLGVSVPQSRSVLVSKG